MMNDVDDDFGELYADVEIPAVSDIKFAPQFDQSHINSSNKKQIDCANIDYGSDDSSDEQRLRKNADKLGGEEMIESSLGICNVGTKSVSEDEDDDEEDDFVVVVNDDEEVRENVEVNVVSEANLLGNGSGNGCGEEVIGDLTKSNGCNSQYKYIRRFGSVSMGTQRATRSRIVNTEDIQQKSNCGRFEPTYAGSTVHSFSDQGNGFWLPRYRTIFDVDINTLEQKPWTHSGANMTDYFNFGFDEDSWRSYCQSLDQIRRQSFTLTRNQGYENLRSNLAGPTKELIYEEFAERDSNASGQRRISSQELCLATRLSNRHIGQAIRVEDSNTERQPSMDSKPPRICDSDAVIEITLQEEPSDSLKEPDDKHETNFEISEKGCEQGNLVLETQLSEDQKANELRQFSAEENACSPTSYLRRSYDSATVSNCQHEKSCAQIEPQNSESETQNSGKVDAFSRENQRAEDIVKENANSDRDSTATNPCVAGLDLLSDDDHIQSSETSYYSHSEELNNDCHNDSRKTRITRTSSPDSIVDRRQGVGVDYHCSSDGKMDDSERKGRCHKYRSRVRSSSGECLRSSKRNFWRYSEMKSHIRGDNGYSIDTPKHVHASGHSRFLHRDEELRHASNFINEDEPSYKEKAYLFKCYDTRFVENQFHAECKEDSHRQDYRGFGDGILLNMRGRWDEDQLYSDRTRRTRGDMGHRDQNLEEREFLYRKRKHLLQNEPHSTLKYCASNKTNRQSKYRDYHDDRQNKRSKRFPSVEYRHSDMSDKYEESPLNDWEREYMDSEMEHQRHLQDFGREARTFDRGDDFFERPSSDLNYPWFIEEDHENHNERAFSSIHDYHDEQPVHAERWHYSSLSRDDADVHQTCDRYERNSRYLSAKKSRDVRRPIYNRDAYDREDTWTYFDQDDHFENRRYIFQSEGMDWQDDALLESNIYNGVNDMLDSVNGIRRCKLRGAKNGLVSNDMIIHTQGMKDEYGVIGAGGKSYNKTTKIPTRATDEHTGLRCRNPVGLRKFGGKKVKLGKLWLTLYALVLVIISPQTLGKSFFLMHFTYFSKCSIACIFLFRVLSYKKSKVFKCFLQLFMLRDTVS
ncbi:hypothetical protein RND81_14G092900 [Saponaria officinalis]|uniref:Pre-mRNA polyadenylation factor Fip1 domain-containing protein n=1 Tax=Saponaria officinalis TaxID=3572 RepID=A0AAW1GNN3_SAPOF